MTSTAKWSLANKVKKYSNYLEDKHGYKWALCFYVFMSTPIQAIDEIMGKHFHNLTNVCVEKCVKLNKIKRHVKDF